MSKRKNQMDIKGMVREFMLEEFNSSGFRENIGDDESLIDSQIIDSLSILQLISFMDEKFGIFPAEGELNSGEIDTINQIVNYILKKLKEKQE